MDECHEIFYPWFFHQTIPPRALIHELNPFRICLRIHRENRDNCLQSSPCSECKRFRSLSETVGSDPVASMTPRDPSRK
jgi:hypothetical protein